VAEAEAAFNKALSLHDPQNPGVHAMRVLAQMKQGLGDHWAAIRVLSKAIDLDNNPERIQCLFLRGEASSELCSSACTAMSPSSYLQSMPEACNIQAETTRLLRDAVSRCLSSAVAACMVQIGTFRL